MFEVKDIMTKKVMTVSPDTNIYKAMSILVNKKISGLPVVDDNERLVGIISEKDMLQLLVDEEITDKTTVNDYMTKKVISFSSSDSAVSVCEFLMKYPVRRVPIVDNGKLVGIVSRRDIIHLVLKIRGKI